MSVTNILFSVLFFCMCLFYSFPLLLYCVDEPSAESPELEKKPSEKQTKVESGVVYDSATLKKSVRDKISMFHGGESDSVGRTPSLKDDKRGTPPPVAAKSSSLPRDAKPVIPHKSASLPKDVTPPGDKNSTDSSSGACTLSVFPATLEA